ncbi:MAG: type IV pilus assembly protein PilM [Actinobacteria bacterium]|nr:MAG: type IV pilus assembly protein PilM [Actinomycetota bacterium]
MIPWNPIHRYAGKTSLFDALDEGEPRDVPVARLDGFGEAPQPITHRAPLGFVDVRAGVDEDRDATEAAPAVEVVASADSGSGENVPFYKREISFGRKKTDDAPADVLPDPVENEDSDTDKVPFYKREVSFRRPTDEPSVGSEVADAVEPAAAEAEQETADVEPETVVAASADDAHEGVEQSTDSADVVAAEADTVEEPQAAAPAPAAVAAERVTVHDPAPAAPPVSEPVAAATEKVPLHKRELSFGKKAGPSSRQSKQRGGGHRSGRKIVGLKIGASQLAAAVIQESDGRHELLELARTPLEPGIVLDGEVRDADALVHALRSFFADQKLPTRDVRIGVASNRIGVRTFEIAGIDDESRFDNAVRFKAHEVLPIAVSDSVLDYRVLEERMSEAGEAIRRILLVVAPRDQVTPYVDVAERVGLKLAGIDLEALGLLRAFVAPGVERAPGGTSTVVVAIGHEASTLLVSGGGACEFTRVFDWGGSTLQEAIAQELQVHPAEAATILRHLSLDGSPRRVEGVDEEARNRALEAVRLRLTPFARELVSSLQFYQTQPESLGIGEIVITGGTSQLEGLGTALHQMIGVQVRVGDPLQRLTVKRGADSGFEHSLGSLAVPIGLAIDDDPMRSVDLTPRDITTQRRRPKLAPVLLPIAAVVPLAALGFAFSQAHGKVSNRQSHLSGLQTQLAAMPQPKGPQIDASIQGAEAARATAVAQVLAARTSWDGVVRDLARVLPANVSLTELKASVPVPLSTTLVAAAPGAAPSGSGTTPASATTSPAQSTLPAAPTGVTITGYTFSQHDVAVLLGRLVALPSLDNVQLSTATTATLGKKDVVNFTILANLRGAGGGA